MSITRLYLIVFCSMICAAMPAFSSIQINSTRVIYPAQEKEVSILVTNPGEYPVLLQSWIDDGSTESKPENLRAPFLLTPPLIRVNGNSGQTLRLAYTGSDLSSVHESVFWINVLEIPPFIDKDTNQIQVAYRSRIKLFYRPESLSNQGAQDAISMLQWNVSERKLILINPTDYFVSAIAVNIDSGKQQIKIDTDMLAPRQNLEMPLPREINPASIKNITVDAINDYGAIVRATVLRL